MVGGDLLLRCGIRCAIAEEMIIGEKLKFPSGTATALLIKVLHGEKESRTTSHSDENHNGVNDEARGLLQDERVESRGEEQDEDDNGDWKARIRLLVIAFAGSALYTVASYFVPQLHDIPIFGVPLATKWLWSLNPSPPTSVKESSWAPRQHCICSLVQS